MVKVYLVIDHWFPVARELTKVHSYFFLTRKIAITKAPKGLDYIADNGTYYLGKPNLEIIFAAIRRGFKFILPDFIADPEKTFNAHLNFFNNYEEYAKKYGFVVLQGRSTDEMLDLFDKYNDYGLLTAKRIAIGGPRERESCGKI